jgi:hypothetical protein
MENSHLIDKVTNHIFKVCVVIRVRGELSAVFYADKITSSAEVKERVDPYCCSPLWAFVACSRVNFT